MNPIAEALLVVACATSSAFIFCAMLGLAWHVIQPNHEADLPAHPLDQDREFIDLDSGNVGSRNLLARLPGEGSAQDARAASALECGDSAPLSLSPKRF